MLEREDTVLASGVAVVEEVGQLLRKRLPLGVSLLPTLFDLAGEHSKTVEVAGISNGFQRDGKTGGE